VVSAGHWELPPETAGASHDLSHVMLMPGTRDVPGLGWSFYCQTACFANDSGKDHIPSRHVLLMSAYLI